MNQKQTVNTVWCAIIGITLSVICSYGTGFSKQVTWPVWPLAGAACIATSLFISEGGLLPFSRHQWRALTAAAVAGVAAAASAALMMTSGMRIGTATVAYVVFFVLLRDIRRCTTATFIPLTFTALVASVTMVFFEKTFESNFGEIFAAFVAGMLLAVAAVAATLSTSTVTAAAAATAAAPTYLLVALICYLINTKPYEPYSIMSSFSFSGLLHPALFLAPAVSAWFRGSWGAAVGSAASVVVAVAVGKFGEKAPPRAHLQLLVPAPMSLDGPAGGAAGGNNNEGIQEMAEMHDIPFPTTDLREIISTVRPTTTTSLNLAGDASPAGLDDLDELNDLEIDEIPMPVVPNKRKVD